MADPTFFPVRPTKRCLDDLGLSFPTLELPLHEMYHPLVKRAQRIPAEVASGGGDRVRALDDRVWFKCRSGNLRAVVTRLEADELDDLDLIEAGAAWWWVGAAGERQDDSASDFYKVITAEAVRKGSGRTGVSSKHLLPREIDYRRLSAELALRAVQGVRRIIREIIARSLRDGRLWSASLTGHEVTAGVRAVDGEAYLAIAAEGFPDSRMIAVILDSVPHMKQGDWMAEPGGAMGLEPRSGQIIYSAIIPADTQTAILDEFP